MKLVETTDSRVSRDIESKALVASNINELVKARAARKLANRTIQQTNNVTERINAIEERLINMERALNNFLSHMSKQTD